MKAILHILEAMIYLDIIDAITARDLSRILKDTIIHGKKLAYVYYAADDQRLLKPELNLTPEQIAKKIMDEVMDEQNKKKT